ncbi:MAG: DUF4160 domain-containing protein [Verrucomicrobia bacterium]|nr:DUF4160 domain-containing protein [Verrucomicrobiota bacterium]
MPTVLRIRRYRIGFFSVDWIEPVHVHVSKRGCAAKFWLAPVRLASNYGFRSVDLKEIALILETHENEILQAWTDYFRRATD